MARRAQSSVSPAAILIGIVLLALAAIGGYFLLGRGHKPTQPPLDTADFQHNSLSLRGNRYSIEGAVERRDRVTAKGQIITLLVGLGAEARTVPVLIPAGLKGSNIEPGYQLRLVVVINKDGLPEAESILE